MCFEKFHNIHAGAKSNRAAEAGIRSEGLVRHKARSAANRPYRGLAWTVEKAALLKEQEGAARTGGAAGNEEGVDLFADHSPDSGTKRWFVKGTASGRANAWCWK